MTRIKKGGRPGVAENMGEGEEEVGCEIVCEDRKASGKETCEQGCIFFPKIGFFIKYYSKVFSFL